MKAAGLRAAAEEVNWRAARTAENREAMIVFVFKQMCSSEERKEE